MDWKLNRMDRMNGKNLSYFQSEMKCECWTSIACAMPNCAKRECMSYHEVKLHISLIFTMYLSLYYLYV